MTIDHGKERWSLARGVDIEELTENHTLDSPSISDPLLTERGPIIYLLKLCSIALLFVTYRFSTPHSSASPPQYFTRDNYTSYRPHDIQFDLAYVVDKVHDEFR